MPTAKPSPRVAKAFSLRPETLAEVQRLAVKDNRKTSNMVDTLLAWCVKQPNILELIKKP